MSIGNCPICSGSTSSNGKEFYCTQCGFILNPSFQRSDESFEVEPARVKKLVDSGRSFVLLDVRDKEENEFAKLNRSVNIPLNLLSKNWFGLDKRHIIITYCHHGGRSLLAAKFLNQKGYAAKSIKGGIDNWSRTIDQSVKRYNKYETASGISITEV